MISVPTWVRNVNLKKKLSKNQNGKKRLKIFVITSFLKTTADKNSKVLGKQNLQFMYDFDFNTYLEVYLGSLNLEKHFCKIPKHRL